MVPAWPIARKAVQAIDNVRAGAAYRRQVAGNLLLRLGNLIDLPDLRIPQRTGLLLSFPGSRVGMHTRVMIIDLGLPWGTNL